MEDALEKLYHSGLQFLLPLTPQETYETLVEEARKLIHAQHGSILIAKEKKLVRVYSTLSVPIKITPRDKGFTFQVFSSGEPLILTKRDIYPIHPELEALQIQQAVFIPLTYYNQALGVMILSLTSKRKITKKELYILKLFGAIATLSIRKTQLYQETKKALDTRDAFLSMISHELKSPVTAMNVYLHLLQKNILQLPQPFSMWIKELTVELSNFTRLLNELLLVEAFPIDERKRQEIVDVKALIISCIDEYQKEYPEYTIALQLSQKIKEYFVQGNKEQLLQAIKYILHNAIKFSSPKHKISLHLSFSSPFCVISIEDKGLGIAKKNLKSIAGKFFKPTGNHKDGLGLGLFLSKSIIEEHKGAISIHSKLRKGTKVTISLPALHIS